MSYPTLDDAREYLRGETQRTSENHIIAAALDSAVETVESHCGRTFLQLIDADTAPTTRTYRALARNLVYTDDFWTTTGLVVEVNGTAVTPSDVRPLNGIIDGRAGFPYNELVVTCSKGDKVEVTARWGWAETPPAVRQSILQLTGTEQAQRDTPLGVAGMGEFGAVRTSRQLPALMAQRLNQFRLTRNTIAVA